jgi:hypothetical protein
VKGFKYVRDLGIAVIKRGEKVNFNSYLIILIMLANTSLYSIPSESTYESDVNAD